jgi:hypothetical protein
MKCRWFVLTICFAMFAMDIGLFYRGSNDLYGQLAALWALVGTMSWLICRVIDEIIEYMDRF